MTWIMYPESCNLHHVTCILWPESCILNQVTCIMWPVSCDLNFVSCILWPVSCIMWHVSSILNPVSCTYLLYLEGEGATAPTGEWVWRRVGESLISGPGGSGIRFCSKLSDVGVITSEPSLLSILIRGELKTCNNKIKSSRDPSLEVYKETM